MRGCTSGDLHEQWRTRKGATMGAKLPCNSEPGTERRLFTSSDPDFEKPEVPSWNSLTPAGGGRLHNRRLTSKGTGLPRGRGCHAQSRAPSGGGMAQGGRPAAAFRPPSCGGRRMPRGVTALFAGADACQPWGEPSRPGVPLGGTGKGGKIPSGLRGLWF